MKEYSLTKEELKISIGQSIANYIVESKKDKLLNELLHIVKRNKILIWITPTDISIAKSVGVSA